jgi:DNA polymerase III epsilon subunit-like protein
MSDPIVWIDLETGGTDPLQHQITQIAALPTSGDFDLEVLGEPFERKVTLVPGRYTNEALELQHYSKEVWEKEAVTVEVALRELIDWVAPYRVERLGRTSGKTYMAASVGGYNFTRFDGAFLSATCDRLNLWLPLTNWTGGIFDVLEFAKWVSLLRGEEPPDYRLETVCKFYGVPIDNAHAADADVLATANLARAMILGW